LSRFLDHNSQQVREQISHTIAIIFANIWRPVGNESQKFAVFPPNNSHSDKAQWFVDFVKTRLDTSEITQTTFESFVGTILHWLNFGLKSSDLGWSIKPYIKELLPAIFQMQQLPYPELSKQAKQLSALVAQWTVGEHTQEDQNQLVFAPLSQLSNNSNWHIRLAILPFLQIASFNNTFLMEEPSRNGVYDLVINLLIDPQIEVRELASVALSSLIRTPAPNPNYKYHPEQLIKKFTEMATGVSKIGAQQHGGVLGLASIVLSSPYSIPSWMPEALRSLGLFLNSGFPLQTTAKNTLRDFWRTHQDMWEEHQDHFSPDQLDFLTQLQLSPSYYA